MAREDVGEESEDERELEFTDTMPVTPMLPSAQPAHGLTPLSPLTPIPPSPSLLSAHPSAPAPPLTSVLPTREYSRKQRRAKERRARKRHHDTVSGGLKRVTVTRRADLDGIQVGVDAKELNATSNGWIGGRIPAQTDAYTLEEVTSDPYYLTHIKWDGR